MQGFDCTSLRGKGPMTGGGMGYCVISLNTPEQELDYLKNQVRALGVQLKQIKTRIQELEKVKKVSQ